MIVSDTFYVQCDVCERCSTRRGKSHAEAHNLAAQEGFKWVNGEDLCPDHVDEYKES